MNIKDDKKSFYSLHYDVKSTSNNICTTTYMYIMYV